MNETVRIGDPRDIADMITMASASGFSHSVCLLEAARNGLIQLVVLDREARFPRRQLKRPNKPTLILIGDDDYQSTGPGGWGCSAALRTWARRAVVHAAGGTPTEYRKAVYDCLSVRRLVLVETSSAHLQPWTRFFTDASPSVPIDLIVPRNGQHPKPIPRSAMQ